MNCFNPNCCGMRTCCGMPCVGQGGANNGAEGTVKSVNAVLPNEEGDVALTSLNIPYDNTVSGLAAIDAQSAIDELSARPAGAGGFPYADGYFTNTNLDNDKIKTLTPNAVNGTLTMVSGYKLVAPEDGLYTLSTGGGRGSVVAHWLSYINKNNEVVDGVDTPTSLSVTENGETANIPANNCTAYLKAGDFLTVSLYSVAQDAINIDSAVHNFTFARIG